MPPSAHDMRPQSSPASAAPPRHRDPFLLSRALLISGLLGAAVLLFDRIIRDVAASLTSTADNTLLASLAGSPSGLLEIHGPLLASLMVISLGGLAGVFHFVRARRRELGDDSALVIREKRAWSDVRDELAVRTGGSAILLYVLFIAVQQLQAMSMGLHFTVGSTLLALPPMVSVGYALLVGLLVASVSLVGTATITRLRVLLVSALRKRVLRVLRALPFFPSDERIDLARLAGEISSRGPPPSGRLAGVPTLA